MPDNRSGPLNELRTAASDLQAALIKTLRPIDAEMRVMSVARQLGIDKSLASKAVRCAKTSEPLRAAHEAPANAGLSIVADAAERAGAARGEVEALRSAAAGLILAIERFPGGRQGMSTALSAQLPALRKADAIRARRSVFRAMIKLAGFELETFYTAYWFMPNDDDPGRCDQARVSWIRGLKRYRGDGHLLIECGNPTEHQPDAPDRFAITGEPISTDPVRMLLPGFSTVRPDELSVYRADRIQGLTLGADVPALGTPADIAQGTWSRSSAARSASAEKPWELVRISNRRPTRVLVADMILGDGVFPGVTPRVQSRLSGVPFPPSTDGPSDFPFDLAEQPHELTQIDPAAGGVRSTDAPGVEALLPWVHRQRGWDPARCRVWRLRIEYPLPTIETMVWFQLPPAAR